MYILDKSLDIAYNIFEEVYDSTYQTNWHFAFAFKKNKLLAIGQNDMRSETARALKFANHFKTKQPYSYKHAEVDCISRMWGRHHIDGKIKFVVLRLNKFGKLGSSKPCKYCGIIFNSLGIDDIIWSNGAGKIAGSKLLNEIEL